MLQFTEKINKTVKVEIVLFFVFRKIEKNPRKEQPYTYIWQIQVLDIYYGYFLYEVATHETYWLI